MIETLSIAGIPQPKGSTNSWYNPKTKAVVTTSANKKLKPWEEDIRRALQEWPHDPIEGPVTALVKFRFLRPQSVKRKHHVVTPDLDKLIRGIFDPMSGIVFRDDKQVIGVQAVKEYAPRAGVDIVLAWGEDAESCAEAFARVVHMHMEGK